MPGRRRKIGLDKYHVEQLTSEEIHKLLVKELGAKLIPGSDKTVPQPWAPPLIKKEEEDMGLFDDLAEAGIDLGDIDLDPFNYADGLYIMRFVSCEVLPPKQVDWDMQMEFTYQFESMADGEPTKYKGKPYTERLRMTTAKDLKSDDADVAKRAANNLQKLLQRIHQLGHQDPPHADIIEINAFKGNRYVVPLNTPEPAPGFRERQWVGMIRPVASDEDATNDLFKK